MFGWLNRKSVDPAVVQRWRDSITTAARNPEPYLREWVPDTIYGRFNMVALVSTLAMRRLRDCGSDGRTITKKLTDRLFSDFDHSLREHGVGDASIARRIRKMGEEFFGLAKAVDAALEQGGPHKALAAVIQKNIQPDAEKAGELSEFIIVLNEQVERLSQTDLLAGPESL